MLQARGSRRRSEWCWGNPGTASHSATSPRRPQGHIGSTPAGKPHAGFALFKTHTRLNTFCPGDQGKCSTLSLSCGTHINMAQEFKLSGFKLFRWMFNSSGHQSPKVSLREGNQCPEMVTNRNPVTRSPGQPPVCSLVCCSSEKSNVISWGLSLSAWSSEGLLSPIMSWGEGSRKSVMWLAVQCRPIQSSGGTWCQPGRRRGLVLSGGADLALGTLLAELLN